MIDITEMVEVRCCCDPDNLVGYLPKGTSNMNLRELDDGTFAYDSEEKESDIRDMPGFVAVEAAKKPKPKGPKRWKK